MDCRAWPLLSSSVTVANRCEIASLAAIVNVSVSSRMARVSITESQFFASVGIFTV